MVTFFSLNIVAFTIDIRYRVSSEVPEAVYRLLSTGTIILSVEKTHALVS
jgi:hypothetical protein